MTDRNKIRLADAILRLIAKENLAPIEEKIEGDIVDHLEIDESSATMVKVKGYHSDIMIFVDETDK